MAGKEHFERLQVLIDLEREAEKAENLRELRKFPVAQREALGTNVLTLFPKFAERIGASARDQVAVAAE